MTKSLERSLDRKSVIQRQRQRKVEAKTFADRPIQFQSIPLDFKVDKKSVDGYMSFEGYASIFNTPDAYKDIIEPGAFEETIKPPAKGGKGPWTDGEGRPRSTIKSLWMHNPDWPLGLPLYFEEDSTGLYHKTRFTNTRENQERIAYMEDFTVEGESIGFMTLEAEWDEEEEPDEDDFFWWPTRYLKKIDLWELSPVTFPAHSDAATVLVTRSRELVLATRSMDQEKILRTAKEMKGITVPMIEDALRVLSAVSEAIKEEAGDASEGNSQGDSEDSGGGGSEANSGSADNAEEGREAGESHSAGDSGDTSEEDPELIKALEEAALDMKFGMIQDRARRR